MKLNAYFEPVSVEADYRLGKKSSFGPSIDSNQGESFPDWANSDIAIMGVSEFRNAHLTNSNISADQARRSLYGLSNVARNMNICDLGNLKEGNTVRDSYAALRDVMAELLESNTFPLVIGGSSDLAEAMFRAYETNKKSVNLTAIDNRPGLSGNHYDDLKSNSYLNSIISSKSKYLFNFTNIGYQSCFTSGDEIKLLEDLLFDIFRLGVARKALREMEPVMRDTDMLMISMSSLRQSDAPAAMFPSPNGFSGEELCQLSWYAGKSERLSSLALFDWYHSNDMRYHTAQQAAQIAWYFIDGFYKRKDEYPFNPSKDSVKYIVNITGHGTGNEIVFYKSSRTERWWMEVPSSKLPGNLLLACSYEDYMKACSQEVPERWWQNFKKINH